jgi:hypothetical protein
MNTNDSTLSFPNSQPRCLDKASNDNLKMSAEDKEQCGKGKNEGAGGRGSRGLKVLSAKVKSIILRQEKVSYKEVAEQLITDNYISRHGGNLATIGRLDV